MSITPIFYIEILTSEGKLIIDRVNDIELIEDWKELSNTGTLKLPRKAVVKGLEQNLVKYVETSYRSQVVAKNVGIVDIIKTGDKVLVKLGYAAQNIPLEDRFVTEFMGYVQMMPTPYAPLEIKLENEMFVLKRKNIASKTFVNGKLIDVVKYAAGEYTIDCVDMDLPSTFIIQQGSASKVLKAIDEAYGIKSFFRLIPDPTVAEGARQVLVVGKPYISEDLNAIKGEANDLIFQYGKNVIDSSLQYVGSGDARIKIKATNKLKKGKDYTIEVGDDDGTEITIVYNDLTNEALRKLAEDKLKNSKVDKFTGDFTTLGFPYVRVGRIVRYIDWRYSFASDKLRFFVDKVVVSSGVNGYRRTITLGWLVSAANENRLTSKR